MTRSLALLLTLALSGYPAAAQTVRGWQPTPPPVVLPAAAAPELAPPDLGAVAPLSLPAAETPTEAAARSLSQSASAAEVPAPAAAQARPVVQALAKQLEAGLPDKNPDASPAQTQTFWNSAMDGARPASPEPPLLKVDPFLFRRSHGSAIFLSRLLVRPFVNLVYDLRVTGMENIPDKGPFILFGNHISYGDPAWLTLLIPRPLRFLMYRAYYENRWLGWLFRWMGAIPVAPLDPSRNGSGAIRKSMELGRGALKRGEGVGIFPEGSVSVDGQLHEFQRGFKVLARKLDVPMIPFYLDGLWGSLLSWDGLRNWRRLRFPWPRRRIELRIGAPLYGIDAPQAREAVERLRDARLPGG